MTVKMFGICPHTCKVLYLMQLTVFQDSLDDEKGEDE
jgi:hypothetical protein